MVTGFEPSFPGEESSRVFPPLRCRIAARDREIDGTAGHVLAEVALGVDAESRADRLVVSTPLVALDERPRSEFWLTDREPEVSSVNDGVVAVAGDVMFGQMFGSRQIGGDLEAATREIYARVFHTIESLELPNLVRLWVTVPRINEREDGLERYRAFCRGRAEAFERHYGESFESGLSASTAVGSRGGLLTVGFLATRYPGEHYENPRQMSAFRYPREYGPRSPSFARATAVPEELGGAFFIAGTSSIVGHATRHRGSFRRQLRESLRNIDVLFGAEARRRGGRHGIEPVCVKVYLRNDEDLDEARELVGAWFPGRDATSYLRADICRSELLVEVEAVGEQSDVAAL